MHLCLILTLVSWVWNYQWLASTHLHIYCSRRQGGGSSNGGGMGGGWLMWSSPPALQTVHYWADRGRERDSKKDREKKKEETVSVTERVRGRMKGGLAYSWLKLKTVGSVWAGDFCQLATPFSFPAFLFFIFPCASHPLTMYFAGKKAGVGALKACFNECWQGVDKQKPKPADLLEKIQSDMFSLQLIGRLRGGGMAGMWGRRDWWGRCE